MSKNEIYKIVLGGDGGTGKSTLLKLKDKGEFDYSSNITIGVDFVCLKIPWKGKFYPLLIYDLGGQQRFQFLHDSYIQGTRLAIILYDITREKTFNNIPNWLSLFYQENPSIPLFIVASKTDICQEEDILYFKRKWNKLKKKFEEKYNIKGHFFISSKNNDGIEELFSILMNTLLLRPYFAPLHTSNKKN